MHVRLSTPITHTPKSPESLGALGLGAGDAAARTAVAIKVTIAMNFMASYVGCGSTRGMGDDEEPGPSPVAFLYAYEDLCLVPKQAPYTS